MGLRTLPPTFTLVGPAVASNVTVQTSGNVGASAQRDLNTQKCRNTELRESLNTEVGYRRPVAPSTAPPSSPVKRLTLDLPADVHRALKLRSVELDVPMAELLRELIAKALSDPTAFTKVTERRRSGRS